MVGAIADLLRWVFTWLDVAVYWLIDQLYWLFTMLTEVSIFTSDQIESFSSRIYVLISIIMLFKLGFSFITYIVNPDSFTDKQKGGTALLKNIVVVVVLLASVPTIFNEAYHLQQIIFKNNVIDRILLGDTSERNDTYVDESGNTQNVEQSNILSTYAFLSFFRPNASISGCDTFEGISISDQCVSSLNASVKDESNPGNAYKKAVDTLNIYNVLKSQIPTTKGVATTSDSDDFYMTDEFYLFDYHWGISTIFGGAIAWILLGFCMDLAVRAVKLSFLQIIAPIPIILSLSPGKKNNTLGNWGKECLSTWVSLFIRVMVISFAMTAIMLINSDGGVFSIITGGRSSYFMVNVFIMLGLLLFAKEFPKLLEDILGLKGAGKLTLNPWKKLGSVPLVGGAMTAGATMAGAGALAVGRGAWGLAKSLGAGVGSTVRGDGFGAGFGKHMKDTGTRMGARIGAGWSSSKDKFTSAGFGGTDKLGGSMHKAYKDKYSTDTKKASDKELEGKRLLRRTLTTEEKDGKKITRIDDGKRYATTSDGGIYKHKEFVDALKTMDDAKNRKNEAQSRYEQMKTQIEAGSEEVRIKDSKGNITSLSRTEAIANLEGARVDSIKASGDFDKIKADFDANVKTKYKNDAQRYEAYSAAADTFEATAKIEAYRNSSNDNLSNQPAGSIAQALNGVDNRIVRDMSHETDVQTRVNNAAGVHSSPTKEEHNNRYDDLLTAFGVNPGNNGGAGANGPSQPADNPQPGGTNTQTPNSGSTQSDTNPFSDRGFGSGNNNQ